MGGEKPSTGLITLNKSSWVQCSWSEPLVPAPGNDPPLHKRGQGRGKGQTEVPAAGGKRLGQKVWSFPAWCSACCQEHCQGNLLPCSLLSPQSTIISLINLMSSPPRLIQLQYCRNNFPLLPKEKQTSEARRALPSLLCLEVFGSF